MLEKVFGRGEAFSSAQCPPHRRSRSSPLWRELAGLLKAQSAEITAFMDKMNAIEGLG